MAAWVGAFVGTCKHAHAHAHAHAHVHAFVHAHVYVMAASGWLWLAMPAPRLQASPKCSSRNRPKAWPEARLKGQPQASFQETAYCQAPRSRQTAPQVFAASPRGVHNQTQRNWSQPQRSLPTSPGGCRSRPRENPGPLPGSNHWGSNPGSMPHRILSPSTNPWS